MFVMFEPKIVPMDTPTFSGSNTENTTTNNSGKDVDKAISTNPTVVFPKPVISATLIE